MPGPVRTTRSRARRTRILCAVALLHGVFAVTAANATEIVIGTGSVLGVYFQVGRGICRLVERHTEGLECSAVPTPGSSFNMDSVQLNAFEVGIVQSDVHFKAYNKSGNFLEFADVSYDNIRSVFSVHGEPFTLVARRDSGIRSLPDLVGRRVNLGNPGSGQRSTMQVVMDAMGWTPKSFAFAGSLPAAQQSIALCHGRIEAMVYVVGHPNKSIQKATDLCDAILVNVEGPEIDQLVAENPYYSYMTIPGGIYRGNEKQVTTFGVRATLVVSEDLDADTVYAITRAVFDNLDQFKKMYPAFDALDPRRMIVEGLAAPLHEGAIRYYSEKGLM
jgi:TRAP transporter TAXI family solute receptor